MNLRSVVVDAIGTGLVIAALLSLGGCGSESDLTVGPAEPRPGQRPPGPVVAVHEVCTVSFLPDGTIKCVCEVTP